MKSFYVELTGVGKSELKEEEITFEDLKDDEAIIQMEYSMISAGTELSRAYGLKKGFSYPVRPGYCGVGRIVSKGKDIKPEVGDWVFFNAPHASLVRWSSGKDVQGPLIMKIDEDIDPVEATAINLCLVALQGVNLSEVKLGYTVGVFGLGNIGILTALMYKKLGCKVIGFDLVKERCALAEAMGLEYTCFEDYGNKVKELSDGKGLDICVDATGSSKVIAECMDHAGRYGQVILLGSPRQSYEADLMPVFSKMHMKNIRVIGAFNKTIPVYETDGSVDCMERNLSVIMDLMRKKDIDIRKLITKIIDPKDCQEAYCDLMYKKDECNAIVYDWRKYKDKTLDS